MSLDTAVPHAEENLETAGRGGNFIRSPNSPHRAHPSGQRGLLCPCQHTFSVSLLLCLLEESPGSGLGTGSLWVWTGVASRDTG